MIEYKRVKLSELHEDPANARRHPDENLADIRASLKEFGQVEPLVVQKASGKIVGGNGRYKVMKELGWDECDVAYVDMDNMKATALGIALNRAGERAEWNPDVLAKLLAEMDDVSEELAASLKELEEEQGIEEPAGDADAEPQIDKAAELQKKWGTAQGQLWLIGDHRLLCGDSTKREDVERVLGGNKPLLMVTDPPYGVEYDADWRNHALRADGSPPNGRAIGTVENDDKADWTEAWKLFPGDVAYIWHAGRRASEVQQSIENAGFVIRCQIIWAKQQFAIGRGDYHWMHEPCWYAVKDGKTGHWGGDRTQTTVWAIDKPQKSETGHSTQKPIECMQKPIANHTCPEVYEPFSGSGTTFVAAQNLKRKCYGIEISPAYCAVILERMRTAFPELEIRQA